MKGGMVTAGRVVVHADHAPVLPRIPIALHAPAVLSLPTPPRRSGILPDAGALDWPAEPFQSAFVSTLSALSMPRFTHRHPQVLATLLHQMLALVHVRFRGWRAVRGGGFAGVSQSGDLQGGF